MMDYLIKWLEGEIEECEPDQVDVYGMVRLYTLGEILTLIKEKNIR